MALLSLKHKSHQRDRETVGCLAFQAVRALLKQNRRHQGGVMRTIEIPARDWSRTLDQFSLLHQGWLVSLDVVAPTLGTQPEIRELPLVAVTAESNLLDSIITIAAARQDGAHIAHVVRSPRHIRIERTPEGADVALEVQSADGTAAILRFRVAERPNTVDGPPAGRVRE
jgi:hypothetical protein